MASGNPAYKSVSGLLLTKDGKTLLFGVTGDVVIPNCVTGIGDDAFFGSGLTSVTIPDSVKSIGHRAFSDCYSLTSVTIGNSVTSIGEDTFDRCHALASMTIGNSLTNIEDAAFCYARNRQSFSVASGNPAYKSVSGLLLTKDGKTLFSGVNGDVVIPNGVTSIGERAFVSCSGLTSVTIPESVASIGKSLFCNCSGLKALYVPEPWKSKYVDGTFWSVYVAVPNGCKVVYGLPRLELAGTERTFSADEANGKLVGVTANVPWTATANVSWLTVTTASGTGDGRVTYNVAANTGTGSRVGKIAVTGGGIARTYTVTQEGPQQVVNFDGTGGTPDVACRTNAIGLAYGPFPSATWAGHAFLGWFTHLRGGTEVLATDIVPAWSPRTLFAHWTTEQTVVFDANGGSTPEAQRTLAIGTTYGTLPEAARPGCLLVGWYTQASGGTAVGAGDTVTAEATRTLYAHWEEEPDTETLPEIADDSKVAAVFAGAADPNLGANIRTAAIYGDFREWTLALKDSDGNPVGASVVLASPHAWASYALGAVTLFENKPSIQIADFAMDTADATTTTKSTASGTLAVRVRVLDGDKAVAVNAGKVAALFRITSDVLGWTGDKDSVCDVVESKTEGDGTTSYTVRIDDGGEGRAFLGIRE